MDCVGYMLYAIVETGGQQLRMEPGRFYDVPCMPRLMPGTKVILCRVLMVRSQSEIGIGRPWVSGALVRARVMHTLKAEKQVVLRRRAKKKSRRKQGHRRRFTRLLVDSIEAHGQSLQGPI
jgi:large subunit ribosomal protein L21